MSNDTTQQAENLVNYLESQRAIIREAQNGYKKANNHEEKVSVMSGSLTQKAQLRTAAPPRRFEMPLFNWNGDRDRRHNRHSDCWLTAAIH